MGFMGRLTRYRFLPVIILIGMILSAAVFSQTGAAGQTTYSDTVKAVFIHHFLRYLQWPGDNTADAYTIAFMGDSPIIATLKKISAKKKVKNRGIIIKQFEQIQEIDDCHILFIPGPEISNLPGILEKVKGKHIVTVSEYEEGAPREVAINLIMIKGKIKFQVDPSVLKNEGIWPSSQFLKLAIIVKMEGEE
jgi:hypothetical protein